MKNQISLYLVMMFLYCSSILIGCSELSDVTVSEDYDYTKVPEGFPAIPFPENNPITVAKIELGRMLFYEKLLSRDIDLPSCSHCMKQKHSFSDNTRISHGVDGEPQTRNTFLLVNSAYRKNLFWDGRVSAIESPAYRSLWLPAIFGADTNIIAARLKSHPKYPSMFKKAFGDNAEPSAYLISQAIATFVRVLISGNSPYDKYIRGDSNALTEAQKRGMELFFSKRTNCSACHSGIFFTDGGFHATGASSHYFDRGRYEITKVFDDWGKFITPSLRNVEVTSPYMHEGILPSLEAVIEHYNVGGRFNSLFNKDTLVKPLGLNQQEKSDLIEFLKALTDRDFLNNPAFSDPHNTTN